MRARAAPAHRYMVANLTGIPPLWVRPRSRPLEVGSGGMSTGAPLQHRVTRDTCVQHLEDAVGIKRLPTSKLKVETTTSMVAW